MTHCWARCCTSSFHNVSFLHTDFLFIVSEAKSISSHHQDTVGDSCNTWIGSFSFRMDTETEIFFQKGANKGMKHMAGVEEVKTSFSNKNPAHFDKAFWCPIKPSEGWKAGNFSVSNLSTKICPRKELSCVLIQKAVGSQWVLYYRIW